MLKNQIAILQCVVVLMCMQVSPLSTENEWSNIESFCLQALDNRNKSLLLVVAGIGPVVNLRFTDTFSAVLWDPPATAGVPQWSLLYSDCDEQQHWSSDCQHHYNQHHLSTTSSQAVSVLHS